MRRRIAIMLASSAPLACSLLTSLSDLSGDAGDASNVLDASIVDVQSDGDGSTNEVALSVTVVGYGPVTGALSSSPVGVSCNGPCVTTLLVAPGTSVTLSLTGTLGTLQRWSGACTGTELTCNVVVNSATSVILTLNAWNYAFVTLATVEGNFAIDGGTAPADTICTQAAANASIPGTFVAYLSTNTPIINAGDRIASARGWIRVDGKPLFDSTEAIKTQGQMLYPLLLDENGIAIAGCAWTGTDTNDDNVPGCANDAGAAWVSNSNNVFSSVGSPVLQTNGWLDTRTSTRCNTQCSFYCFGTDLSVPLPNPMPAPTRLAFVSTGLWTPSTGISAADALCASEAQGAALAGTFQAMLSTPTQSASARFDLTGANWARTDGVLLATSTTTLATGNVIASLDVHANGTYATAFGAVAWTGATAPNQLGMTLGTCNDWTASDAGAVGAIGVSNSATPSLFGASVGAGNCNSALPVYCFQE